jgi:signal transduction histidine kinase
MCSVLSSRDVLGYQPPLGHATRESMETERIIATARVVLALSSLLVFYSYSPTVFRYTRLIYIFFFVYSAFAVSVFALLKLRTHVPRSAARAIHGMDIVWSSVISVFINGPNNPFNLFLIFAVSSAAFRWGVNEVLVTSLAGLVTLAVESVLLTHSWLTRVTVEDLDIKLFIMRSSYLVIFAMLISYLSESAKRRRLEALTIAQISARARVDEGLRRTLQGIFEQILRVFGAREVLLAATEAGANSVHVWRMEMAPGIAEPLFTALQSDASGEENYLFALPEGCASVAWRSARLNSAICVRKDFSPLRSARCRLEANFVTQHRFTTLLVSTVSPTPDVAARIFLFDPRLGGPLASQLSSLQELTNLVAPAVYNVYLLRGLRSRAAAIERARLSRDLHDGIIQTLHALAFRLYTLRMSKMGDDERFGEILDLQQLVQKEAANLRMRIEQLKPVDVGRRHVVDLLSGMINRYRDDTGIDAQFVCDVPEVNMLPNTCREVAGILQEALANVHKHSGAERVLVRLGIDDARWMLTIEDDGRGFEFPGRLEHAQLENSRRGPFVIKERVRAISGELVIESRPGQGARLEIRFPRLTRSTNA